MNRKLVKAKGTQLEIVRHLMKMNKKPIEINRNMYKIFVMKLINILRLLLKQLGRRMLLQLLRIVFQLCGI